MALRNQSKEIARLVEAFESEAGAFHDLDFHTYYLLQSEVSSRLRVFRQPNHAIMLRQYYGVLDGESGTKQFVSDVEASDTKWGIRGAEMTLMGVVEGDATPLFVRMASRAGNLFDENEAAEIQSRIGSDTRATENGEKPVFVMNTSPIAIWLNYLLFHLSLSYPGRDKAHKIEPEPFSLSLLALERLATDHAIGKSDRSVHNVSKLHFRVALSFPGEKRRFVSHVADILRDQLGTDAVFYDLDYQAQLARPNLDTLLQSIYRQQSDLIVVFLCAEYARKDWCGLEWRAVRDIIKSNEDRVMFVRFDDADVAGVFSIDGYIDANRYSAHQVADFVLERVATATDDA